MFGEGFGEFEVPDEKEGEEEEGGKQVASGWYFTLGRVEVREEKKRQSTHHSSLAFNQPTIGPSPCTDPTCSRSSPTKVSHCSTGSKGRILPRIETRSRIIESENLFSVPVTVTSSDSGKGGSSES